MDDAVQTFEKGDFVDPAKVIGAHEMMEPQEITFGDVDETA